MAYIDEVSDVIKLMAEGIESAIESNLSANKSLMGQLLHEQLMAGQKPNGTRLQPSYMKDPYFTELAEKRKAKDVAKTARKLAGGYVSYKARITPPSPTRLLGLPARDRITPNLYIVGTYHNSIGVNIQNKSVGFTAGASFADAIKSKYGDILDLGESAKDYLITNVVTPGIEKFYKQCGW